MLGRHHVQHLTIIEAAKALNLSVPTVKRYIYEGRLKSAKLPGGQHRIPETEIERLLSPEAAEPSPLDEGETTPPSPNDRIEVLERWVTELEAELERLAVALDVVSRYCLRTGEAHEGPAGAHTVAAAAHRVLILGPGCRKCDALQSLAARVLQSMGRGDVVVERVKDLDDVAAFGPVLTPGLVVDGQLVLSGRVPNEVSLRKLLAERLA
jgi:excisionase family DNA binding protein